MRTRCNRARGGDLFYAVGSDVWVYYDSTKITLNVDETLVPSTYRATVVITLAPNPIENGLLEFTLAMPQKSRCRLELFSADGKHVKTFAQDYIEDGIHSFKYNMEHLPKGNYLIYQNSFIGPSFVRFTY